MNFTQVNVAWYYSTFIFYIFIILGTYLFAETTKKCCVKFNAKKVELWYIFVPSVLLFVKGFGTTGRDLRAGYYYNFTYATSMSDFPDYTVEYGYRLLNVIIRNITDRYWVFVIVVAVLSLYPVFKMLKKYSDRIDLPIAVLMYASLFFFSSFSPLRMCLSAAIGLLSFDSMIEKKSVKALVWIIVASLFHTSALILFVPYFFYLAKWMNKKMIATSLIVVFLIALFGRNSITALMASDERYFIYQSFESVSIGAEQIVYFIPLLYVVLKARKYDSNRHFFLISFSFIATAFCMGLLGYVVSIFGRFRDMFLPLIIIIPYYIKVLKAENPKYKNLINVSVIVYCVVRFYIYISQYCKMEDLMPYTNIFGWVI